MRHQLLRDLEQEFSRPICILAHLQGPKLRCGDFQAKKVCLEVGQKTKDYTMGKIFLI